MSLTVNENAGSGIEPIPEGTHLGVCNMLIDLGVQYNETYNKASRKVLIGWELPEETIELEDGEHPRTISKRYTASLDQRSNLRRDLAAWRGRDFTPEELKGFDLHNIVGASCLLNVIHNEASNGKKYANISSIVSLPKGMKKAAPSEPPVVFDLDTADLNDIDKLPKWIADIVKESETYKERAAAPTELTEEEDFGGELPF